MTAPKELHAVERFYLRPTIYSPNSRLPVLLYQNVLPQPHTEENAKKFLETNDWEMRGAWGHIPIPHFHPNTHECYGIFQGSSTLIIGRGKNDSVGGIYIPVQTGDVIVLPAGTTHCCSNSKGDYRYVGVYPKQAPRWRNEYGNQPVDVVAIQGDLSRVEMPTQDPVYGHRGPLIYYWSEALESEARARL
ncbi:hypothetical protein FQN57_004351 [Myotisia sp. PD_48]|nr:hypothetical protein FQN57_004351 [Myotisia sp. PD_48]